MTERFDRVPAENERDCPSIAPIRRRFDVFLALLLKDAREAEDPYLEDPFGVWEELLT